MVAWWRRKVVPRARRAWAAVSRRIGDRKPGKSGGILKLRDDVQSCGYKDVQVMFDMITSELEAASKKPPLPSPHKEVVPRPPPSAWSARSSSTVVAVAPAQFMDYDE